MTPKSFMYRVWLQPRNFVTNSLVLNKEYKEENKNVTCLGFLVESGMFRVRLILYTVTLLRIPCTGSPSFLELQDTSQSLSDMISR